MFARFVVFFITQKLKVFNVSQVNQKPFNLFQLFQKYTDIADGFRKPSIVSSPVLWQPEAIEAAPDAVNLREKARHEQ